MWDLTKDPGEGNLNVRAYVASIVGPRRVVHGLRAVRRVTVGASVQLLKSTATGKQATYYEVWLPNSQLVLPGGGARFSFSGADTGGGENGFLLTLTATQRLAGVILGDDQLFAEALTDAVGGALAAQVPVVVSSVVF